MNKINLRVVMVMVFLVFTMVFLVNSLPFQDNFRYSFTKAICDENNLCQDYIVTCEKDTLIGLSAITGAVVQFGDNWEDPRSIEDINKVCN